MSQLRLLTLALSLLQAAGQNTCDKGCTQGGHTSSCKDRISWAKVNVKDGTGTPIGVCAAITLVNGDCKGQCSCADSDLAAHCGPPAPSPTPTPPSPSGKFCGVVSSKNSCKPCTQESDCGVPRPLMTACTTGKDEGCTPPPPLPPPSPVGFCQDGSSANKCKPCATEADCGLSPVGHFSCWDHLDENCIPSTCPSSCNQGGHAITCKDRVDWAKDNVKDKTGAPIGVCAAITLVNGDCKGQCECKDKDFDADCTVHAGWCKKSSKQNACKGCDGEDDCGNDDSSVFDCQKAKDPSCSGPGPAPAGAGWCTKEAPSNSCGHCSAESDCGNTASGKYFCQAAKSFNCPMDDIVV